MKGSDKIKREAEVIRLSRVQLGDKVASGD